MDSSNPYTGDRLEGFRDGLITLPKFTVNNRALFIPRFPHTSALASEINSDVIATFEIAEICLKKGSVFTSETRQLRIDSTRTIIESGLPPKILKSSIVLSNLLRFFRS